MIVQTRIQSTRSLVSIIQRFEEGDSIVNLCLRPHRWIAGLAVHGQRYHVNVFAQRLGKCRMKSGLRLGAC